MNDLIKAEWISSLSLCWYYLPLLVWQQLKAHKEHHCFIIVLFPIHAQSDHYGQYFSCFEAIKDKYCPLLRLKALKQNVERY